jgi:hypothetical protein
MDAPGHAPLRDWCAARAGRSSPREWQFGVCERSGAHFADARQDRHDFDNGVNDSAEDPAALHRAEFLSTDRLELWMVHLLVSLDWD